jgi:phosphoglycerate dehydrogenase-like enzyme
MISSLNHPNICALYDVGSQDGIEYLVLEYVEGETLEKRLQKGPLPTDVLLRHFSSEPPPLNNPLLHAKNCIITPHIAWATKEARMRLIESAAANLRAFLEGHPINVVN